MPASDRGLACSMRPSAFATSAPRFAVLSVTWRQWVPSGSVEPVVVGLDLVVEVVAELVDRLLVLVVPGVADPLPEQHREDVGLEVGRVDRPAERVGAPAANVIRVPAG